MFGRSNIGKAENRSDSFDMKLDVLYSFPRASVSALQRLVEQLKLQAGVERIQVSRAAELQQYPVQNACKDRAGQCSSCKQPLPGAQIL
ncbi:Guanine nucleotide-binding protein G(I)/G(S)/G(O) subunit gamma-10 [Tupaia chinensis]|uniref:Guanine nucleotide-binding protein G(I)/G(S)/G(O) subunit gamma-10 n=1 Tax=Tupaia chinensis TaxID=246437 RepID=L9KR80_TUPCH|nr:Guanine nucleotide-binding protein G(I)/G(S)/G(O) subunit gamma-10 [Tupaia chinensis]